MMIRSLPESLSVISTVTSAQVDMSIEGLDALVRAELNLKKNPHNPQGRGVPRANQTQIELQTGQGIENDKCHLCKKKGNFKKYFRKYKK